MRQIERQRDAAIQGIEQRVLAAFHGISASHPRIRFSREGLKAAEQNYESVNQRYLQNAVTQLDLLDAQSTLVQQKQEAATATYAYLADIHALQRSLAWFEYDKSIEEKRVFLKRLQRFVDGMGEADGGRDPVNVREEPEAPPAAAPAKESGRRKGFPWTRRR